jgi:hypothetical protein
MLSGPIVESAAFRVTLTLFGLFCFVAGAVDLITGHGLPFVATVILLIVGAVCMYVGYRLACKVHDAPLAAANPEPRRGVGWWLKRTLVAIVAIAIPISFLIPAFQGTRSKTRIAGMFGESFVLKTKVEAFFDKQRRLPLDAEARGFQMGPSDLNWAQSIAWDPASRAIVVTLGEPQSGKRFALHAEERDGKLDWTCRTIDLETKYLPASCR